LSLLDSITEGDNIDISAIGTMEIFQGGTMTITNYKISERVIYDVGRLTEHDIYLFKEGNYFRLHEKLGSHLMNVNGINGVHFAVWAPNAEKVSVTGDFNRWDRESHRLMPRWDGSGIWEGFIPDMKKGDI